jgi:hypothetical protein
MSPSPAIFSLSLSSAFSKCDASILVLYYAAVTSNIWQMTMERGRGQMRRPFRYATVTNRPIDFLLVSTVVEHTAQQSISNKLVFNL